MNDDHSPCPAPEHAPADAVHRPLRRRLVLGGSAALVLGAAPGSIGRALAAGPTPACGPQDEATPRQTEGPYFKARSPERHSLVDGSGAPADAPRLVLVGQVLDRRCRPVAGALLDFWHADAAGDYDNRGFRCRGHQFADAEGRYRLETVQPGLYPGRTRHLHVKVQPPGGRVLTTQLYFAGEAGNTRDFIYRPALEMGPASAGAGGGPAPAGLQFSFVLDAG